VASEPHLSIGALDGPAELSFNGIRSVLQAPGGEIAVLDAGSGEVRFFDREGAFLRSFGREGDGPGEFQFIRFAGLARDSIWIYDSRLNRLTFVDLATSGFRSAPVEARALNLGAPGALADGSLLLTADVMLGATPDDLESGMGRSDAAYVHVAATGETIDTILVTPGAERFLRLGDDFVEVIRPPFGKSVSDALRGDRLLHGGQDAYEIRMYDLEGTLLEIARRPAVDVSVSESAYLDAVDARIALTPETAQAGMRRTYEAMPRPTSRPAFGAFVVDALDHLWVQDFSVDGDASTWAVFSPDGAWLGEVTLPDRFRPTQILEDEVLGVWRDDLDVEYVRAHALMRG
jgi:hypothetical protein